MTQLLRNPKARLGAIILAFFVLMALLAPVIAPGDPTNFVGAPTQRPTAEFWFGTDGQGRDVFAQTVWGARISLIVGFGTAAVTLFISAFIGLCAGYFRGRLGDALVFLINLFLLLPGLPLLIILSRYLQPGTLTVIFVLALTGWAFGARILRSQALALREKDFVSLALVRGESHLRIIFFEILPNMISLLATNFIFGVNYGIGASTALAFLGLTNISDVTWGTNLYWAQSGNSLLLGAWWTILPSGLCIAIVTLALVLLNYGIDEIANPRLQAERDITRVVKQGLFKKSRATPVTRLCKTFRQFPQLKTSVAPGVTARASIPALRNNAR